MTNLQLLFLFLCWGGAIANCILLGNNVYDMMVPDVGGHNVLRILLGVSLSFCAISILAGSLHGLLINIALVGIPLLIFVFWGLWSLSWWGFVLPIFTYLYFTNRQATIRHGRRS